MTIETITSFFMWCTIINCGLLALWALMLLAAPNLIFRTQQKFFPGTAEQFRFIFYGFIGLFKIFVIVFNLVPWLALLIIR